MGKRKVILEVEADVQDALDPDNASRRAVEAVRVALETGKGMNPRTLLTIKAVYDDTEDGPVSEKGPASGSASEGDEGAGGSPSAGEEGETKSGVVVPPGGKVESVSGEKTPEPGEPGGPESDEQRAEREAATDADRTERRLEIVDTLMPDDKTAAERLAEPEGSS